MKLAEAISKLPKSDLHCHLDGSMRAETILDLAKHHHVDLVTSDIKELKRRLVCGERVSSLPVFLQAFDITCAVLQWASAIERVTFELAEDAAAENVRYLEVRLAPSLCKEKGMSEVEVLRAIRKGLARAESRYPIRTGILACALRIKDPSESTELARIAASLKNEGVVGFDLVHAERGNPPGRHQEAYAIAKAEGMGRTVHAGEDAGPEYIREALDECQAQRIGHGLTLHQDSELEARVAREKITVECCPSSNVQINLIPSWKDHPLPRYLKNGVQATLSTDNRLLTGINVTDEYLRAQQAFGFSWSDISKIALNGFRGAFLPEREKGSLVKDIEKECAQLGAQIDSSAKH